MFFTGRMPFLSPNQQCQSTRLLLIWFDSQWKGRCAFFAPTFCVCSPDFDFNDDDDEKYSLLCFTLCQMMHQLGTHECWCLLAVVTRLTDHTKTSLQTPSFD